MPRGGARRARRARVGRSADGFACHGRRYRQTIEVGERSGREVHRRARRQPQERRAMVVAGQSLGRHRGAESPSQELRGPASWPEQPFGSVTRSKGYAGGSPARRGSSWAQRERRSAELVAENPAGSGRRPSPLRAGRRPSSRISPGRDLDGGCDPWQHPALLGPRSRLRNEV